MIKSIKPVLLLMLSLLLQPMLSKADTFPVTNTLDNGPGSFRQAIFDANATTTTLGAPHLIDVQVSGVVNLISQLPTIFNYTVVQGPSGSLFTLSGNFLFPILKISDPNTLNDLVVTISNIKVQNGFGSGGGMLIEDATVVLNNCQISQNLGSQNTGAGILINNDANVTILNSTINNNINSNGIGGGLAVAGLNSTLTITNSTLSNNVAGVGGAIDIITPCNITINSSTIANNISQGNGGGIYLNSGFISLNNCFVGNNDAQNVQDTGNDLRVNPDSSDTRILSVQGHNLFSDSTGFEFFPGANTSGNLFVQPGTDLISSTLSDNGGATQTLSLTACSPAIDAGSSSAPANDQRGVARVNSPDIGSYEYNALSVNNAQSCGPSTVILTVSGGNSGANAYTWFDAPVGGNVVLANSNTLTLTNQAVTDTFYVAENAACTTPRRYRSIVSIFPVPAVPTITTGGLPTSVCSGGNIDLTAVSATQPVTYQWSVGSTALGTNVVQNATQAGSYTVTITTAPGAGSCSRTSAPTTLNFLPPPPVPTIQSTALGSPCSGDTVTLSTNAVENFYQWNFNGSPLVGDTGTSIRVITPGDYTLTVSSTINCSTTSSIFTLNFNPLPAPPVMGIVSGDLTFCLGDSVVLQSSYPAGNTWRLLSNPGNVISSQTSIAIYQAGTYRLTHTDGLGCSSFTDTVIVVHVPVTPTITESGPVTFCDGDSVVLVSSSANSYLWLFNGVPTTNINDSIVITTSQSVSVVTIDINNCPDTSTTVQVVVNPIITPVISPAGPITLCQGETVQLSSSVNSGNIWSNGAITQTISVGTAGNYIVTIPGCSAPSVPVTVLVNPLPAQPVVNPGDTSFCEGNPVTFTSSTSGGTLVWNDANATTGNQLTISQPGNYVVTVTETDANSCSSTSNPIAVVVHPTPIVPQITAAGPTTFCQGDSVVLSSNQLTGITWYEASAPALPISNSPSRIFNTPGTYYVVFQDDNECLSGQSNSITVTVNVAFAPFIQASGPLSFCEGDSVNLFILPQLLTSILWSPGNQTTAGITVDSTLTGITVTITDANNCSATSASVDVTSNQIVTPEITSQGVSNQICAGDSLTLTSSSLTNNVWFKDGDSLNLSTSSIVVSDSGSYTVIVSGCSNFSAPFPVSVNPIPNQPQVSSPSNFSNCAGDSVLLVTTSVSSLYQWNQGILANNDSVYVEAPGAYHVTVFNAFGCSSTSADVNVTFSPQPASPVIVSSNGNTLCSGGSSTLSASNYSSGLTWTLPDNSTLSSPTISASQNGTYSAIFTDQVTGCSSLPTLFNLQVLPSQQPSITILGSDTFCQGGSVVLTSNLTSGFTWQGTPPPANPNEISITVTQSGTFTLLNTVCNQSSNPVTITVNPNPTTPVISPSQDTAICQGSSLTLVSSAPSGNTWNDNSTNDSLLVVAGGNYFVTVTDANGCSAQSLPVNVSILTTPLVSLPSSTTQCGGQVVLNATTPGSSYVWSGTNTTAADTLPTLNVTATGTYSVTVTNVCGSTTSNIAAVTINPLPIISLNDTSSCDPPIILDAGNVGSTYLWSNASTNQQILAVTSGNYTVQVTNAQSCSASKTITVTINTGSPVVNLGNPPAQCGGSILLDAGNPGALQYQWSGPGVSPADTNRLFTANQSGVFSVTVTNACGSSSGSTTLTIHTPPSIELGGSVAQCGGTLQLISPLQASLYVWSGPGILGSSNNDTVLVNETGTYTLTITDANNCTASDTKLVNLDNTLPTVNLGSSISTCADTVSLDAGNPGSSYDWSGVGTTAADTNQTYNVTTTGAYFVTVTNGCGSTVSNSVNVEFLSDPSIDLGPDVQQCGGTFILNSGISGANSYQWTRNGQPIGGNQPTLTVTQTGTYIVLVSLQGGCQSSDTILVNLDGTLPVVNLGGPYDTCASSITLTAGGPQNTYSWTRNGTALTDTTGSIIVNQSGSYIAAATNGCGTTTSAPAQVSLNPTPVVSISDASACNAAVLLDAGNAGSDFVWTGQGITAADTTQIISVFQLGTNVYNVSVTNVFGCTASDSASVQISTQLPVVNLVSDTTVCQSSVTVDAGNQGFTYTWNDIGPAQAVRTFSQTGLYFVDVTNACGTTRDSINITIGTPFSVNINNGVDSILQCILSGNNVILTGGTFSPGSTYAWTGPGFVSGSSSAVAVTDTSGIYSLVVVQNACISTDSIYVGTFDQLPVAPQFTDTTQCGGTVTLDAGAGDANTSYAWTGAPGLPATQTINVGTGNYMVTITNACGSSTSDTVSVTINSLPVINLPSDTSACGGSLTLVAGTFPLGTTFVWTGPGIVGNANQDTVVVDETGAYSVTVTNSFGCSSTDQINVNLDTIAPVVNLGGPYNNCADSVLLNAGNPGMLFSWTGPEVLNNTQTNWVSAAGTYIVTVTNGCGISSTDSAEVNLNPPPTVSLGSDTAQCGGNITLSAGNFPVGTTYLWTGPGIVGGNNGPTVIVNATGSYSVLVTNTQGCTGTDAINVNLNSDTAVVNLGGPFNLCADSLLLDAGNPGFTFTWSGPEALNNTQTNYVTTSGTYIVSVTNGCGFAVSDTAIVNINPVPVVSLGPDTSQCGGSVTLNAGTFPSGTTIQWTGPAGFTSTNAQVTINQSGTYSVTVTVSSGQGCSVTDAINVNLETTTPVVNLGGPFTDCIDSVLLDAGNPGMSYSWTGPETLSNTQTNYVSTNGVYSVVVTNGCGVTATDSATLNILVPPSLDLGNDTANCGGVQLTAGTNTTFNYAWTGPGGFTSSNASIQATVSGDYIVNVSITATSCSSTDTINVNTALAPPSLELGAPLSVCNTSNIINAGTYPVNTTFAWTTSTGVISGPVNTNTITATQTGRYYLTITNICGSVTDSLDLTLLTPVLANVTADGPTTICQGQDVVLSANPGATSYFWTPNGETTQTITVTATGSYSCTVTSANGCSSTSPLTQVNVSPAIATPQITAGGPTSFCQGGSVTLTSSASSGNLWSNNSISNSITVNLSGTYTVTVTQGACSATSLPFTVTVFPEPFALVNASGSQTFCKGDSVVLQTGSFTNYQWFKVTTPPPNQQIGNAQSVTIKEGGNYFVIVTDANGCTARSFPNTNVVVRDTLPKPVITQTGNISACGGGSITFSVGSAPFYEWSTGATGNSITVNTAGVYYVDVFTSQQCKSTSDTIKIEVTPSPPITVSLTRKEYPGNHGVSAFNKTDGEIYLSLVGGIGPFTYAWTDSSGNGISSIEDPIGLRAGNYTVLVTDASGCTGTASIRLTQPLEFKLPEGFSPNGDGKNDTYVIGSIELYPVNKFLVFNRWGNIVYSKDNYANEWDGKGNNGTDLPDGTYFLILEIPGSELNKGFVELRR